MTFPTLYEADNTKIVNFVEESNKEGRLQARHTIESFESAFKKEMGSERGDMDIINDEGLSEYFVGGAYVRSLLIPKNTAIVSELWKKERLWIISSGEVTFTTEIGTQRVKAPYVAKAPYGSKVALYAHEDTLWFAITGAESTNSEEIEEEIVAKDYTEFTYPWDLLEKQGEEK